MSKNKGKVPHNRRADHKLKQKEQSASERRRAVGNNDAPAIRAGLPLPGATRNRQVHK